MKDEEISGWQFTLLPVVLAFGWVVLVENMGGVGSGLAVVVVVEVVVVKVVEVMVVVVMVSGK